MKDQSARRKGWPIWKIMAAALAGYFALSLVVAGVDRLLPGWEAREAQRAEDRLARDEAHEARQAARAVERRIREAAREARAEERNARAAAEQAEQARRDAIREAACRRTQSCWTARHLADADRACRESLESFARFQSRWTMRAGERRFTHADWLDDGESGRIVYSGDRIELQNGFGVWQPHIYECLYDPGTRTGLGLSMQPGRL